MDRHIEKDRNKRPPSETPKNITHESPRKTMIVKGIKSTEPQIQWVVLKFSKDKTEKKTKMKSPSSERQKKVATS